MIQKKQYKIVHQIVKDFAPIRTEQVKIKAMYEGVSCGDRYLRWLQEDDEIEGKRIGGDKTKTWTLKDPEQKETEKESSPFKQFIPKPLTMEFMRDNRQELDRVLV